MHEDCHSEGEARSLFLQHRSIRYLTVPLYVLVPLEVRSQGRGTSPYTAWRERCNKTWEAGTVNVNLE